MSVLGGTGDEGYGLALRWAKHGYEITIGSRDPQKAKDAAAKIQASVGKNARVSGLVNTEAASKADIVVVTVPFSALSDTLKTVKPSLRPGQIVVNVTVPLETSVGGSATRTVEVWDGSAGQLASRLMPKDVKLVTAFNNVSAEMLNDLSKQVDCDVLVCGRDDDAKKTVLALAQAIPGVRGIDAGPIENSRTIEQITALLVSLNIRHGVKSAGLRITGVNPKN
ncbi:MAG TPA: NADPH-dependent F420 reductase [Candidatus Bathyarchaeia archaeon]|nr:NADPH-dependent F420 reductase [Candidatus Bathyarchaeia archaeon]